jgi:tRNA nucleotidyltransferase/poly(A) polymerase
VIEAPERAGIAELLARPGVQRIFDALDGNGEETRVVGGAVRNALLLRPVHEVDFATTALPEVTTARAGAAGLKVVPTGLDHGTVTVIVDGEPFEVTTLREDLETDGRRAKVRFGRSFAHDARRRDFTINALSVTRDGRVADEVGGLADLAAHRVRFIGDPAARIREDYLRILRFFRFHAEYAAGPLDLAGFHAAIEGRAGLAMLSRERVGAEFRKLLVARRSLEVVGAVSEAGFFAQLLGGVADLGRLGRAVAFESEAGLPADPARRLAAVAVAVAEDADRLRERLRLSNAERDRLAAYAGALAHMVSLRSLAPADIRRVAAGFGTQALGDVWAAARGEPAATYQAEARAALGRFVAGDEAAPTMPLRGADLIARGAKPGPGLGALMDEARALWLSWGAPTEEAVRGRLADAVFPSPPLS